MGEARRPEAASLDTITRALERAVANVGDSQFLDIEGECFTYREVDRRATRFAHSLMVLGVGRGDRVVTLLETSVDVFTCWLALSKIGAIWVPINLAYKGEFLRHQVHDTETKIVICESGLVDRLAALSGRLPHLERVLFRGEAPPHFAGLAIEPLDKYRGDNDTPIPNKSAPDDIALIIYTSGTTGPSKGCMLSQNVLCHLGRQHIRTSPRTSNDVEFTCLPTFHIAALYIVFAALLAHNGVALVRHFSVSKFWDEIERSRATMAMLIASIFPLVARAPDSEAMKRCHGRLRIVSGVPISSEIRKIWQERFGAGFLNAFSYGQTEGSKLTMVTPDDPLPPLDSAGRVAEEFDVRIVDENDNEVPDGEVGEIVYRPLRPHIMFHGYWKRPEETAKAWRNLWMHTGDLGRLKNGYLFFVDRKKDYLRSRGENISSSEVEATFINHPAVLDVAVHAVQAGTAEDEIKVTLVIHPESSISCEDICRWSIDQLPYFAVPRYFETRLDLPRNGTGKVLKYQLRDEGITPATWDRESAGIAVRRR